MACSYGYKYLYIIRKASCDHGMAASEGIVKTVVCGGGWASVAVRVAIRLLVTKSIWGDKPCHAMPCHRHPVLLF
jgi:hypothetical protein